MVGDLYSGKDDSRKDFIAAFLVDNDLAVPNTFEGLHDNFSGHDTWFSNCGTSHRYDYVLIDREHFSGVENSRVFNEVDLSKVAEDHKAVAMRWSTAIQTEARPLVQRRWPVCDRDQIFLPDKITELKQAISQAPCIPWEIELSSHAMIADESMRGVLAEVVPLTKSKAVKFWMSPATESLVLHKSKVTTAARKITLQMCWDDKSTFFAYWK